MSDSAEPAAPVQATETAPEAPAPAPEPTPEAPPPTEEKQDEPAEKRRRGRPAGSKDKQPRAPRAPRVREAPPAPVEASPVDPGRSGSLPPQPETVQRSVAKPSREPPVDISADDALRFTLKYITDLASGRTARQRVDYDKLVGPMFR